MDKEVISNLLRIAFPQYHLMDFNVSIGFIISLYTENADTVLEVYVYSEGNPKLVVFNQAITLSDLGVLRGIFDMNQTGLFSFELKGIK